MSTNQASVLQAGSQGLDDFGDSSTIRVPHLHPPLLEFSATGNREFPTQPDALAQNDWAAGQDRREVCAQKHCIGSGSDMGDSNALSEHNWLRWSHFDNTTA